MQILRGKKAMPILSFPAASLLNISVNDLINDSSLQAEAIELIVKRCDSLAAIGLMDLSVEAEAFGAEVRFSSDEVPTVIGALLKTEKDIDYLKVPRVGVGRTQIYIDAIFKVSKKITDRPVFAGIIGPFSLGGRLMDMTEIMINCLLEPMMVHKCLGKATEFLIDYCKAFKKAGANGVIIAEPAAGLLSPDLIQEFSTIYVNKIIEAVKDNDFAIIYHNCGNVLPLFDSIKTIKADAYHFGNSTDLGKILEIASNDVIIMGNIDPVKEFRSGSVSSIYTETKKLLNSLGHHKNFIISSGCDIPPLARWENIDSFFKAAKEYYAEK